MADFTPGPWKIADGLCRVWMAPGAAQGVGCYEIEANRNAIWIAQIQGTIPKAGIANARLIAAAPDLLEAPKAITEAMATKGYREWWSGWDGCKQKSELAIAKAEGKS